MSRFYWLDSWGIRHNKKAFRPFLHFCGVAVVSGCLALGCTINPVVTAPQAENSYYDACEQAAENYCEQVVKAGEGDLEGVSPSTPSSASRVRLIRGSRLG